MPALEVKGLQEAIKNLNDLNGPVKLAIGRAAALAAMLVVSTAVKAATYTTFNRQTGAIKAGFGVRVGKDLKGTVLTSVVVEYPQSMIGNTAMTQAYKRHHTSKGRSRRAIRLDNQLAFWWRYLEFGTQDHRNARKPKGGYRRGATRHNRALAKFIGAKRVGGTAEKKWVRPAFDQSAQAAVDKYISTFGDQLESKVNAMPK